MKKRLLFAMLLAPIVALGQTPSPQSVRLLKLALSEDYGVAVTNGNAAFSWGVRHFDYDVQAIQLAREYRQSPMDAATRYDGHWIKINGPIERMGVDKTGLPFVDIGVFSDSSAALRATFDGSWSFLYGQSGPMVCKVTGTRSQKPVLTECRYQYLSGADRAIPPFIDEPVNDWLSDGKQPWFAPTQGQEKALSAIAEAIDKVAGRPECRAGMSSQDCQHIFLETIQRSHDVTK